MTHSFSPSQPGTYVLTAEFPGDNLNSAAFTSCGDDGTVTFIPPGPQPAVSFQITAPANTYVGQPFAIAVTAYDAYSQVATSYSGTVQFSSSNGATLPAASTLIYGRATFQVTANASGSQTITATDTVNPSITATSNLFAYPQSTFVVTSTSDADNGGCGSVCTLRDAINAANAQSGPATITFNIPNMSGCTAANDCTIALGATLPAINDHVAINGSANNARIKVDGQNRRILNVNSGARAVISALTLQGGFVVSPNSTGGAIHNDGTLFLSGMTFTGNANSNVSGGAVGNGNTGTMEIVGCTFSNNFVFGNSANGGALHNQGNLTVRQSTFQQNTSQNNSGGAIRHDGGSMTIVDTTFTNNSAPQGHGGAISKPGSATIRNSTFLSNSAAGMGGAIHATDTTTLTNSTFYGNSTNGSGGRGGSAFGYIVSGSIRQRITNCTFVNNTSGPNSFGAISNYGTRRDIVLRNVLLANNTRGNCGGDASLNVDSSNMSDDASCGGATQKTLGEINPGFPANNGGPTQTIALVPGSAAIDAGNDDVARAAFGSPGYGAGGVDQRGAPRPQGSASDVGAYEVLTTLAPPTVSAPSYDAQVDSGPIELYNLTNASPPPPGGASNFSGQGVTGNNGAAFYFDPTGIPIGTPVTVTYHISDIFNNSSSVTFTIRVIEARGLVVTTGDDVTTPVDGLTSLREALVYAQTPFTNIGFGVNGSGWTLNGASGSVAGSAGTLDDVLTITPATQGQRNSAWLNQKVNVNSFTASFRYTHGAGTGGGDGMTLTFQNAGLNALGGGGGALGYGGIGQSVAFAFNIYNSGGSVLPGFAVYTNGAVTGVYTPVGNGVSLVNGQPVDITIAVSGATATLTMTQGANVFTTTFNNLDIASIVGGNTAYVGFTGATGGAVALQQISRFNVTAAAPAAATITFAPPLAGQTVTLSTPAGSTDGWDTTSACSITGNITINGPTSSPGVTLGIGTAATLRHFVVRAGGSLALSNLTLAGGKPESAGFNRGGAISAFGNLTARNCTFTGNTSPGEGGAIQNWPGAPSLVLENCTFSGNSGGSQGGAFSANSPQATLRYLTITNNTAPSSAVVLWGTQGTLNNSILAGNTNDAVLTGNGGTFTAQSTNNLLGAASATGLTNGSNGNQLGISVAQLNLGPLGNNGGPTATHPLYAGSRAINAGVAIAGIFTDQRGATRSSGPAPDIGAFEYAFAGELPYWREIHSLALDGSQDLATPAGDGVANLLKYAFNMAPNAGDLAKPNITILPENGTAGLPFISIDEQGRLVVEFIRRKAASNPGIAYTVETGHDLNALSPLDLSAATIVGIDATWERVTVTDPTVSTERFGRVRVQKLP